MQFEYSENCTAIAKDRYSQKYDYVANFLNIVVTDTALKRKLEIVISSALKSIFDLLHG